MATFAIPVVLMIDADSIEEAQKAVEEWGEEIDMDDLPAGTEDMDCAPACEFNDEGQRLLYLPSEEETPKDLEDESDEEDDFNDAEENF